MAPRLLACASAACLRRAAVVSVPFGTRRGPVAVTRLVGAAPVPRQHSFATASIPSAGDNAAVQDTPRSLETSSEDADPSVAEKRAKDRLQTVVKKHLRHMSDDPWAVGQYVEKALARDAFDEALLLVQKASAGDQQVVVAWNHLIDYQFNKQQLKRAIKLYNDMKKRGQLPNARTFTVMFRGLAQSQHPKQAVAEAVKHYNVLLNDKRLEPNSIHLNAVLNVCARAGDMDNMFLIANSVNESTRSPTAFTYTTIFNALRHSGIPRELSTSRSGGRERGKEVGDDKLSDEQRYNIAVQTLDRAKGLWEEVVRKWSAGRLVIDEELVCSMGRLLLASPRRADKRQIFDLLEQTMKMPNLVARPELGTSDPDESMRNISAMSEEGDKSQDKRPDVAAVSASRSSSPPKKRSGGAPATHAIPGRNTLALVLSTLSATRDTTAGIKYWNLMVRHYGVLPDRDNWLRLLGMLKVARAGAHAASIVDLMPDEYLRASKEKGATDDSYKPFRIAMEACVRDNLNRNTVANANRVLDSMLRRLERPDLHTLRLYLRVCLVSHAHLRSMPDAEAAKRLYGTQITEALGRLWDPYKAAHYRAFKAGTSSARADGTAPRAVAIYNAQREVIALARHIISAFDKVVNEHLLPDQDLRDLKPITAKINREVQAFYADRESREPSLPSAVKRAKQKQQQQTSTPAQEDTRNPEDVEADISLRQGSEWVWDTYRPPRTDADTAPRPYSSRNGRNGERREKRGGNKMMYPWESDSTNARSQPRPRHQSRPGTRYGRSNDRPGSRRQ